VEGLAVYGGTSMPDSALEVMDHLIGYRTSEMLQYTAGR
jgi:hypothetical protein